MKENMKKFTASVVRETNFYDIDKRHCDFYCHKSKVSEEAMSFLTIRHGDGDRVTIHFADVRELYEQIVEFKSQLEVLICENYEKELSKV